jgi:hypothetical protein
MEYVSSRHNLSRKCLHQLVIPWGRFGPLRKDLEEGSKTTEEGGTGAAKKFWEWSEEQVKSYV